MGRLVHTRHAASTGTDAKRHGRARIFHLGGAFSRPVFGHQDLSLLRGGPQVPGAILEAQEQGLGSERHPLGRARPIAEVKLFEDVESLDRGCP